MEHVSVIIPMYNCESIIQSLIYTLKKQTYSNIEVILVDDGSEDYTIKFCEKAIYGDQRFTIIPKGHEGVSW